MGNDQSKAKPSDYPSGGPPPPYSASNTGTNVDDSKLKVPSADGKESIRLSARRSFDSLFKKKETDFLNSDEPISEDQLATLRKYEVWIIVDDSGSMGDRNQQCWREARTALAALAEYAGQYDSDGLDMFFLNSPIKGEGIRDADSVLRLFDKTSPYGGTPIGTRLDELLREYLDKIEAAKAVGTDEWKSIKPLDIIIITDGEPTDDPETTIISAARRLDKGNFPLNQVGIQFVQVGNDSKATKYLKQLDNDIDDDNNMRDMIDTTSASKLKGKLSGDALVKILLGGVNRRLDKEKLKKK